VSNLCKRVACPTPDSKTERLGIPLQFHRTPHESSRVSTDSCETSRRCLGVWTSPEMARYVPSNFPRYHRSLVCTVAAPIRSVLGDCTNSDHFRVVRWVPQTASIAGSTRISTWREHGIALARRSRHMSASLGPGVRQLAGRMVPLSGGSKLWLLARVAMPRLHPRRRSSTGC
jgi:hypothetical protein